jgi:hypothetical protein
MANLTNYLISFAMTVTKGKYPLIFSSQNTPIFGFLKRLDGLGKPLFHSGIPVGEPLMPGPLVDTELSLHRWPSSQCQ